MRLLNLHTLEFREFFDADVPPYAILSHRWGEREITYKDMRKRQNLNGPGYDKILGFCTFARQRALTRAEPVKEIRGQSRRYFNEAGDYVNDDDGYVIGTNGSLEDASEDAEGLIWGWVDTCCIDKSSSAELSEAINSMFQWYSNAAMCCVYMIDVPAQGLTWFDEITREAFQASAWFTRGWTLQELLAPEVLVFCNVAWEVLAHKCQCEHVHISKHRESLHLDSEDGPSQRAGCNASLGPACNGILERITGIREVYLSHPTELESASIACRMSWAARRTTSRVEDIAYCLLGIFNVHIPIMYGEGSNAFRRLQEELIRCSHDQSIFAWAPSAVGHDVSAFSKASLQGFPVLASAPSDFGNSSDVAEVTSRAVRARYAITKNELEWHAAAQVYLKKLRNERIRIYLVALNCGTPSATNEDYLEPLVALFVHRPDRDDFARVFLRSQHELGEFLDARVQTFYLRVEGAPINIGVL